MEEEKSKERSTEYGKYPVFRGEEFQKKKQYLQRFRVGKELGALVERTEGQCD